MLYPWIRLDQPTVPLLLATVSSTIWQVPKEVVECQQTLRPQIPRISSSVTTCLTPSGPFAVFGSCLWPKGFVLFPFQLYLFIFCSNFSILSLVLFCRNHDANQHQHECLLLGHAGSDCHCWWTFPNYCCQPDTRTLWGSDRCGRGNKT